MLLLRGSRDPSSAGKNSLKASVECVGNRNGNSGISNGTDHREGTANIMTHV